MRVRGITEQEYRRLRRRLPRRSQIACDIMRDTGLRISDVLAISPRDLKRRMTIKEIKTGNERPVTLSPPVLKRAREYCREHGQSKVVPYNRTTIGRDIAKAAAKCGYTSIGPHSLRKLYARNMRANGATPTDVQKELGHKSLACTMFYLYDV